METSSSLSILYLFFALAIGGTLTFALTRNVKWLDYTVFLFLAGVATSLVVSALPDSYGYEPLKDSILQWTHIDPKLILFAFLPTMLFGEAQTLNLGQVKRIFAPAFLVAVPGAAFVAWLLAITLKYVLGLDWDWSLCWLVGSILSATDPVAVVAVLKNTVSSSNSQKRLTYLIVVEALLNDGSALVLYGIIGSKSANESGGNSTIAAFALYFLKVLTISPALGAALGFAATLCMKFFDRRLKSLDSTCQVVVTIVCAYLSFFIAEYILHVSGVVSCCTAGLVVSYLGMPLVLNHETMETVWSMLEWAGITLIFLLSGLIVGNRSELFNSSRAVGAVFAIYFALFVTRGLLRFLCHLPVSALVPGYSYREAIFATFAGLHEHVDEAVFVCCWCVALTIIVNGSLVSVVLDKLGLTPKENHHDSIMVHYVEARLRLSMAREYLRLKNEFPKHDADFVMNTCSILRDDRRPGSDGLNDSQHVGPKNLAYTRPSVWWISSNDLKIDMDPPAEAETEVAGSADEQSKAGAGAGGGGVKEEKRSARPSLELATLSEMLEKEQLAVSLSEEANNEPIASGDVVSCARSASNASISSRKDVGRASISITRNSSAASLVGKGFDSANPAFIFAARNDTDTDLTSGWAGINLSPAIRDRVETTTINEALLEEFRVLFMQVVHLSYVKQIAKGKLPRGSDSALDLFDSADYAMEHTDKSTLQDWKYLQSTLSESVLERALDRIVAWMRRIGGLSRSNSQTVFSGGSPRQSTKVATTPRNALTRRSSITRLVLGGADAEGAVEQATTGNSGKERRQSEEVHMILSFIEAHEYAQRKIKHYLSPDDHVNTTEEAALLEESKELVQAARALLESRFPPETLSRHLSKNISTILLHSEEDLIFHFLHEGVISISDASYLESFPRGDLKNFTKV